jgi:hypothetical protein
MPAEIRISCVSANNPIPGGIASERGTSDIAITPVELVISSLRDSTPPGEDIIISSPNQMVSRFNILARVR